MTKRKLKILRISKISSRFFFFSLRHLVLYFAQRVILWCDAYTSPTVQTLMALLAATFQEFLT